MVPCPMQGTTALLYVLLAECTDNPTIARFAFTIENYRLRKGVHLCPAAIQRCKIDYLHSVSRCGAQSVGRLIPHTWHLT